MSEVLVNMHKKVPILLKHRDLGLLTLLEWVLLELFFQPTRQKL